MDVDRANSRPGRRGDRPLARWRRRWQGRRARTAGEAHRAFGEAERIVVIGGGMTAHRFLEALVSRVPPGGARITLLCEESMPPYDRVHLGAVVAGRESVHLLRGFDWYAANGIEIRLKEPAIEIDRAHGLVITATGAAVAYDRLVIATGSSAFRPPIPGAGGDRVSLYRSLEDAERIARAAEESDRIVVAGGGLLGLEVADQIQSRGCEAIVVERAPRLLPRQLDVEGGAVLVRALRARGFDVRLSADIRALVSEGDDRLRVDLGDGDAIPTDWVVFAAGARPQDAVARAAGLDCHPDGGIRVDAGLETSDPAIFAIGECARFGNGALGFVAPGYQMAEVLAARWTGGSAEFAGSPPSAKLKVPGLNVAAVGESLADGRTVRDLTWFEADLYRRIVLRDGRLVGAIAVGDTPDFMRLQEAIARRMRVGVGHERRFARTGSLWRSSGAQPIELWSDDAIVCTCTGVTCGALRRAWSDGCHSSELLGEATGAGTGCGTCKPLVAELAGEVSSGRRSGVGRGMPIAAALALGLVAAAWAVGPIPMSVSVLETPNVDFLWRDAWWKQASGFTLLGLMVAALALPVRDRLPRLLRATFSRARVWHAGIGVATVLVLGVHTGLRTGANLNQLLMTCVVGLLVAGSLAGLVSSAERRLPARYGTALRVGWKRAHTLLFWPVPVLVLFHVLAVYVY